MAKRRRKQADPKRSVAAKRGWETRRLREKREAEKRERRKAAARKGWETRRKAAVRPPVIEGLRETLKDISKVINQLGALTHEQREALGYTKLYRSLLEEERKLSALERRERKDAAQEMAETDPELIRQSIKDKMLEIWRQNPKQIPSLVRETYETMLEYDLGEQFDETEIWDIYGEL